MTKSRAQLDREIKTAVAGKGPDWFRELNEKANAKRRASHGDVLRAIRNPPVAIVMTDRNGRDSLAIVTREMSNPGEGAWRASLSWRDGPTGHVTRATLGQLARELASDYAPVRVRVVDENEVIRWTSTAAYANGARAVLEVQAWNERQRRGDT